MSLIFWHDGTEVLPGIAGQLSDFPSIIVECAFGSDPMDTPAWSDISPYVRNLSVRRGRNDELQRMEAGICRITLDNRDRRFDPSNTLSPYHPQVKPMKKIRVRATWNSVTYDLHTGYIERWPQNWRGQHDAFVTVDSVDGFEPLAQAMVNASFFAQPAGERITELLDGIGWSSTDRNIDEGHSTIIAETLVNTPALQHLQDVSLAERGYVFIDGSGKLTYHDRHRRLKHPYLTPKGTFGDQTGELPYVDMTLEFDKEQIKNDILVKLESGGFFQSEDPASINKYFRRSYAISPKITSDIEAASLAAYLLGLYKEPLIHVKEVVMNGRMDADNLWPQLLSNEIGDRISVKRTPPGGGERIVTENHIEAVSHDIKQTGKTMVWTTKWNLSRSDPIGYFWLLGDATLGVLNSTTRLAY